MLRITYQTFEPELGKSYTNTGTFKSMEDFRLYACALFSGRWAIADVEYI